MLRYLIYPSIDSSVHISGHSKKISKTFWSEGKKSQHMHLKDNLLGFSGFLGFLKNNTFSQ